MLLLASVLCIVSYFILWYIGWFAGGICTSKRRLNDKVVVITGHLYIYFRNVRPPCLDPSLGPERNPLHEPAQGRAIPRWNRLGKRNRSMKKKSRFARARGARKRVTLTT